MIDLNKAYEGNLQQENGSFDYVLNYCRVSTVKAVTDSKLKDRITFGARMLSMDGRDALK